MMNKIICIAGPTASGKSKFALEIAHNVSGEIINADALQVYHGLQVLSARPTPAEMSDIPHHLYGHVSPSLRYSTGAWLRDVDPLIIDILARGKPPILVGGTGLYFKALTEGLAHIPTVPFEMREKTQTILETGIDNLRKVADDLDPVATARVLGNDPQRLFRIVSVALGTSKPLSAWQANTRPLIPKGSWQGIVLLPPRERLYTKINDRFADMVNTGGLTEAEAMMALNLPPDLPAMKAIGLRELMGYLKAEISLEAAIETAMRETRRFAKRQHTWLRGQMQGWTVIDPQDSTQDAV